MYHFDPHPPLYITRTKLNNSLNLGRNLVKNIRILRTFAFVLLTTLQQGRDDRACHRRRQQRPDHRHAAADPAF